MKHIVTVVLSLCVVTSASAQTSKLRAWKSSAGTTIQAALLKVDVNARTVTLLIPKDVGFDQLDAESLAIAHKLATEKPASKTPVANEARSTVDDFASLPYDDKVSRLFAMTWDANDLATNSYRGNSEIDTKSLKDFSWLNCVQMKTSAFFKDAGIKLKTTQTEALIELPEGSDAFKNAVRILDKYHFALLADGKWIVFRARDWEDDHYRPFPDAETN